MGGYGPPGRTTGGGYCSVLFLCALLLPLLALAGCEKTQPRHRLKCIDGVSYIVLQRNVGPGLVAITPHLKPDGRPYTCGPIDYDEPVE